MNSPSIEELEQLVQDLTEQIKELTAKVERIEQRLPTDTEAWRF